MQTAVGAAMNVSTTAKNRLRKCDLHFGIVPILSPLGDELQLTLTQQNSTGNIHTGRVVIGIADVIGAWSLFGNSPGRTRFEFAVFQDREIDVAPVHVGEIHADALTNFVGVDWIRQMACLSPFDFLDVNAGARVSTIGRSWQRRDLAAFTPQVWLARVVVVRQANGGTVFNDFAKVAAKLQPRRIVTVVVVDLVAGKEEYINILLFYIVDDVIMWEPDMVIPSKKTASNTSSCIDVTGEAGYRNRFLVNGVLADGPLKVVGVRRALPRIL